MIIGSDIKYYEKVSSTNEVAAQLLSVKKASHGTVISASFQTSGKGQRNNKWHSEALKNLIISIILYPKTLRPSLQFYISGIISIAVAEALEAFLSEISIKWPNDIYYANDKIAGILIENSIIGNKISSSICGIGVNINQENFPENLPNPTSLKIITGKTYNINTVEKSILDSLNRWFDLLTDKQYKLIDLEYTKRLYKLGEMTKFRTENVEFYGKISGVNSSGQLQISTSEGINKTFSFKEVEIV